MGHTSRNIEDSSSKCELMNCGGLPQEVSEEKNFSVLPRDHSCDILIKNVAVFCSSSKSLPEAKVESFGLMLLTGKTVKTA